MAAAPRKSRSADIREALDRAEAGEFLPVHVFVGAESFLVERAVRALKRASLGDGPAGFNDDVFHGNANLTASKILAAARTLPMMAQARFVLVRDADALPASEHATLAAYLEDPSPSTCLVLTAEKLDMRLKLAKAASARGALAEAKPLKGAALRSFAVDEARRRGHELGGRAAQDLLDAIGEDLAALDDALERLSLFVGKDASIGPDAVQACVSRIAVDSIWSLVDAVGMRDGRRALAAAGSLLADREPPQRILAMIARQLRIIARMREALAEGLPERDAASAAGAPPFKARELKESARRFNLLDLSASFNVLAGADLELKSSRVPDERVLEDAILRLCRGERRALTRLPRHQRTYR